MSSAEKKQTAELNALKAQLEVAQGAIKTSVACEDLMSYCKDTPEPFSPEFSGDNPWTAGDTPCCNIA
jgi:hypothetical protein